ncbi:MAG: DNA cytosine methyltransferase [Candidatus Thorarchaeota archaeon]
MMLRVLDLFSGAGGFSYGFSTILEGQHLAVDNNPEPLSTFSLNYSDAFVLQRDIGSLHSSEIEQVLGKPDIIIASPPCEEFSLANPKSATSAAERIYGTGTARLFLDTIRLISDLEPDIFVIENVAALLQAGGKDIIRHEMEQVGIDNVHFNLVRSHQHGNPSKRLRVFISNLELNLPRSRPPRVMEAIGDLPPLGTDALFVAHKEVPNHVLYPLTEDRLKHVRKAKWGQGARHYRTTRGKTLPNWVRLSPDQLATSIIGLSRYIHPYEDRLLTVREHARLMSYPDDFIFTGYRESRYNQVGESVPPIISQLIAQEVLSEIE